MCSGREHHIPKRNKEGIWSQLITQLLVLSTWGDSCQLQVQGSPTPFLQRSSRSTEDPLSSEVSHKQILSQGKFYNCRKFRLKPGSERPVRTPNPACLVHGAWILFFHVHSCSNNISPASWVTANVTHCPLLFKVLFLSFNSETRAPAISSSFLIPILL